MSETKTNRTMLLQVRLTPKEMNAIQSKFSRSSCRKMSDYTRKVLLDKPITVNQRNQSLDECMNELIELRNELNAIGNNFNQAVKRINTLQKIEEFKSWFLLYEATRKILLEKVETIKQQIAQINDQWLQL
jgi:uncharacterized protein YukE